MFSDDAKGPLMYINSVQTNNDLETGQKIYDSREKKIIKEVSKPVLISEDELKKLNNIVILYQKNIPVVCKITCPDRVIEGVPKDIVKECLIIMCEQEDIVIPLSDILDYMILEF